MRSSSSIVALVAFVYARSELALRKNWKIEEAALAVPGGDGAVARGEHLAITRGCTDCHGEDLGGHVMMEVPAIGRMAGPNLTHGSGGLPASFSDADFEHAIRHGFKPDGRAILFMPTRDFAALSDADTADLIAYVKTRPSVDRALAPSYIGPVGRALFAFGQLPMLEARLDRPARDACRAHRERGDRRVRRLSRARMHGLSWPAFFRRTDSRCAAGFSDSGEYHAGYSDRHWRVYEGRFLSGVSRRQEA